MSDPSLNVREPQILQKLDPGEGKEAVQVFAVPAVLEREPLALTPRRRVHLGGLDDRQEILGRLGRERVAAQKRRGLRFRDGADALSMADVARLGVRFEQDSVWLSQAQMVELFDKNKRTISEHIRNFFKEGELQEPSVVRKYQTTADDRVIDDTGLAALTLLVAASDPKQKETLIRQIMHMLTQGNTHGDG